MIYLCWPKTRVSLIGFEYNGFFGQILLKGILCFNIWWKQNWNWPKTAKMTSYQTCSTVVQVPVSQNKGEWQDVHQYQVLQVQYTCTLPTRYCLFFLLVHSTNTIPSTVLAHGTSTIHSTMSLTSTAATLCWFNYLCNCSNLCRIVNR